MRELRNAGRWAVGCEGDAGASRLINSSLYPLGDNDNLLLGFSSGYFLSFSCGDAAEAYIGGGITTSSSFESLLPTRLLAPSSSLRGALTRYSSRTKSIFSRFFVFSMPLFS